MKRFLQWSAALAAFLIVLAALAVLIPAPVLDGAGLKVGDWEIRGGRLSFGTGGIFAVPNSTTLPATCAVGDLYMDTDATSGQRIYGCESTNTWVLQGGGSTSAPYVLFRSIVWESNASGNGSGYYANGIYTQTLTQSPGLSGGQMYEGNAEFADVDGEIMYVALGPLPTGYDISSFNLEMTFVDLETGTNTHKFFISVGCLAEATAARVDFSSLTYSTVQTLTSTISTSTANQRWHELFTGIDGTTNSTTCAATTDAVMRIERDETDDNGFGARVQFIGITIDAS